MAEFSSDLMAEIRARFAHVDSDPFAGERVFFENAGGALTLNSAVETTAKFAAIPDNQGRDNPASKYLVDVIAKARDDIRVFLNAPSGPIFVGESGTELCFRLIRTAVMGFAGQGGDVIGSTLEHPASRSAAIKWAEKAGLNYISVPHDDATGCVTADAYAALVTPNTKVATIIHTSPVTGMGTDIAAVSRAIRAVAPECLIIVDGIQHAAHGGIDLVDADVDGYVISAYKVFSRHGYGVAWASDRLTAMPLDNLLDGPALNWEMGTRDTGAYATFSDVVDHFDWLGGQVSDATDRRARILAGGAAMKAHETALCDVMIGGIDNLKGLADMDGVTILGGPENPAREGLVSFYIEGTDTGELVAYLNGEGVRTHIRRADHYSGGVLRPLGRDDCVRVSMCHYNSMAEVKQFLVAMQKFA